jgi:hypothetical protein
METRDVCFKFHRHLKRERERERKSKQTHIIHICKQNYEDSRWIGGLDHELRYSITKLFYLPLFSFFLSHHHHHPLPWHGENTHSENQISTTEKRNRKAYQDFFTCRNTLTFHSLHHCSQINTCPKNNFFSSYFFPS